MHFLFKLFKNFRGFDLLSILKVLFILLSIYKKKYLLFARFDYFIPVLTKTYVFNRVN